MTFKEARSMGGAYIARFKDGQWFAHKGTGDSRNVYYCTRAGSLWPETEKARKFMEKKGNKGVDKWWLSWYNDLRARGKGLMR